MKKPCRYWIIYSSLCCFILLPTATASEYQITTTEMPPYSKNYSGLAIDIVKELFKRADMTMSLKIMPLKRAIKTTREIKANNSCVFPIQRTQEREADFKWVGPIIISQSALFSLENHLEIAVLNDALQYNILVTRGSAEEEYWQRLSANTESSNNDKLNILKLSRHRAKLWASDVMTAFYYAKKNNIKIKNNLMYMTSLKALACNIETPDSTISKLNTILEAMYHDGTIQVIFNNYIKELEVDDFTDFFNTKNDN